MHEQQQFATEIIALIPDGATWIFQSNSDDFDCLMSDIKCSYVGFSKWAAVINEAERQLLIEQLQIADEESYWFFGTAYSIDIVYNEQLILQCHDGMEFIEFSKNFKIPESFRLKYLIDGQEKAKQANDW